MAHTKTNAIAEHILIALLHEINDRVACLVARLAADEEAVARGEQDLTLLREERVPATLDNTAEMLGEKRYIIWRGPCWIVDDI